jgi:hypothetical protein
MARTGYPARVDSRLAEVAQMTVLFPVVNRHAGECAETRKVMGVLAARCCLPRLFTKYKMGAFGGARVSVEEYYRVPSQTKRLILHASVHRMDSV